MGPRPLFASFMGRGGEAVAADVDLLGPSEKIAASPLLRLNLRYPASVGGRWWRADAHSPLHYFLVRGSCISHVGRCGALT
jgi:hypothetical protein